MSNNNRPPSAPMTPAEKAAHRDAYALKSILRLIADVRDAVKKDSEALVTHLGTGQALDHWRVKRLVQSQAMAYALSRYFPEDMNGLALPELLVLANKANVELREQLMLATRDINDCGEINSTCSMTRAFAALSIAARSKLASELAAVIANAAMEF